MNKQFFCCILVVLLSGIAMTCSTHPEKIYAPYPTTKTEEPRGKYTDLALEIDTIVRQHEFNGVILVTSPSTIIYSVALGFFNLEERTSINSDAQFVIGSISKQITAVLVLREYEKGKIKLNDKIGRYLNDINQPWAKKVTIHQLLTHTHGIVAVDQPLEFKPGAQFQYSQLGYDLLAKILENVTGETFEALSTQLFKTCGLNTTFHPANKGYRRFAQGYEENEDHQLIPATGSLDNYPAAGGFISTVTDLVIWNEKLYSGQLVSAETLKLMSTKYATRNHPIFGTIDYGYGLLFKDGEQQKQIGALGYAPGFVSACYYYPQTNINLVVLENTARHLDDFRQTFHLHTEIMKCVKQWAPDVKP